MQDNILQNYLETWRTPYPAYSLSEGTLAGVVTQDPCSHYDGIHGTVTNDADQKQNSYENKYRFFKVLWGNGKR